MAGLNFASKLTLFVLKFCEKNSSANIKFEIFAMAFRARKLFGTFKKRAPGLLFYIALKLGSSGFQGQYDFL